ncbi:amidase [Novosphingobium sp. AP12]|uniref:amidase n=1 Tax=Novosphingobium sp. AP12 TaxID=1144305 RepID=UPI000271D87A|nr:amidase [Novosphingobium sp. AP12]EJL33538.1 amidase, Asp-tRNAAsn/Glu-tRNAGln amidotransferase A subunit [Novosphingobium sp. AP12]
MNDLVELADAIADGTLSAEAAVTAALDRAREWSGLNAFVALEPDTALDQARACDQERARGRLRGPLHGVPLAHKDMFFRAGIPTEAGSLIWRGHVPAETSPLIARLEAAGAITIGRLHMAEFAMGPTGHNAHLGRCANPWDEAAISGGSSSGSGAAVGARIVMGALGSDTGGSVRLPAAFCGVAGLKPTNGLLPDEAMMPLSGTLDTAGPLATSSRSLARLMSVLTASGRDYEVDLAPDCAGLTIGVPTSYFTADLHSEVAAAFAAARQVFVEIGARVIEVAIPDHSTYPEIAARIWAPEAAAFHARHLAERPQDFGEQVRNRLKAGAAISPAQYLAALGARKSAQSDMLTGPFAEVDLLLTPAARMPVPLADEVGATGGAAMQAMVAELSALTRTISMLGFPALVTPMGFDTRGLPLALQLIGPPNAEPSLLRAGFAYEQAAPWLSRIPFRSSTLP